MSDKYEMLAIFTAILLLFMTMLSGCAQKSAPSAPSPASQWPAVQPAPEPAAPTSEPTPQTGTPVIGGTESVNSDYQQPTPPPEPVGAPSPEPASATAPANGTNAATEATAPPEPERLTVSIPGAPGGGTAHFVVTIQANNTPADSKVFLEAYNIGSNSWKAYEMNNTDLLGWNVVIDLSASGGVDTSDNTFHYRYSRTGDYSTAEKMAFESPSAYRTRSISEVAGKFVQDQVTEWRG